MPNFSKTFYLRTDTSDIGPSAILLREVGGVLMPIAYASRMICKEIQGLFLWTRVYTTDRPTTFSLLEKNEKWEWQTYALVCKHIHLM